MSTTEGGSTPIDQTVDPEPRLEFVAAGDSLDGTDQVHTGSLDIGESVLTCGAPTDAGLRAGVIAVAAVIAAQLGRPVLLRVTDATGGTDTRDLAVRPDGVVEVPSSEGTITGDEDLAPFTGPCRACGEEQEVIAASCSQCGTVEPLRVSAHGEVPLAVLATLPEEAGEEGAPEGQYDPFDEDRQVEEPNGVGVHDPSHDVPTWPLVLVMLMEHGGANVRIDAEQWPLRAESMAAVRALSFEHIRQHGAVPLGRPVRADVIDPTADPTQVIVGLDGDVTRIPDGAAPTSTCAEEPPVVPVVMAASPRKKSAPRQRPAGKRAGRGNQLLVIGSTSALAALVIAALAVPQSISPISTVLGLGTEPTGATTATPEPTPAPSSANTAPEGSAGGSAGGQSPTGGRSTASPRSGGEETEAAPQSSGAPQTTPGALAPTAPTAPVSTPGEQASTSAPSAVESSPVQSSAPSAAPPAASGDDRREPQDTSAPADADQDRPRRTTSPSPAADESITVAAGDSLSAIADQVGESVEDLVAANDLRSADQIEAGQRLVVAGPAVQEAAEQAAEQEAQPRSTPAPVRQDPPRVESSREQPRRAEVTPAADGSIVVAAGQTLGAIADQVGESIADLVAANNLPSPDEIRAGQELVVAGPALSAAAEPDAAEQKADASDRDVPAAKAAPEQSAAGEEIMVKRGDTLTEIAERARTSVEQLAELNALPSPDLILAGQKLLTAPPVTDVPAAADDADALAPEEQPELGAKPTTGPSAGPTTKQTGEPTTEPSAEPTTQPSAGPTAEPSAGPTTQPSAEPTTQPSAGLPGLPDLGDLVPGVVPSAEPTTQPSAEPTTQPSAEPTTEPSAGVPDLGDLVPRVVPGAEPRTQPSAGPTAEPSAGPTTQPSAGLPGLPDFRDLVPGVVPGAQPTTQPTGEPTTQPSAEPTAEPSTVSPSVEPSEAPSLRAESTSAPPSTPTDPSSGTPSAEPSEAPSLRAEPTDLPAADLTSTLATVSQPLAGKGSSDGAGDLAGGIASSLLLVGSTKKLRRSRDVSAAATLRAMVTSLTRPVGAWAESSAEQVRLSALRPGGALHAHVGDLDLAVGAIGEEESWQNAADGAYADRWRTSLSRLRDLRIGRGATFIRFAHEWNAPWHPWQVRDEDVPAFMRAWSLYRSLQREAFPEARLVFCVARQSDAFEAAWTDATPSSGDVDLFGVDYYIAPHENAEHSPADFVAGLLQRDRFGAPVGLEAHRQHAESQGKALVIGEWSHLSQSGPAAGFAQGLRTYIARHAGTGAGQIAYDVPLSW